MEKSKKRTKILISAILLGVFLIGAVVSIVLVLAASTQNVTSNITVSYVADGVGAKVSSSYAIVPTSASASITRTAMTTSSGAEEVTFSVAESETEKALAPAGDITLSTSALKVVFEYVFENTAETAFSIELIDRPTGTNMTETYYVSGTRLSESDYRTDITETSLSPQAVTSLGQKVYVYIMASVINENLSAGYNGGFNWKLNQQSTIDVTLNTEGTTSTLKVIPSSAVAGIAMPVLSAVPTSGSKVFLGYYTAASAGTKYIEADGRSAHAADLTTGTTLYAQFSEETVVMSGTSVTGMTEAARTLGKVVIPETTTEIGANAFENETSLTEVTFAGAGETESYADGSALTTIGANAFKGCSSLTELVIPEGAKTINTDAFVNCSGLKTLIIPSSVTSISNSCMVGCTSLEHLEFPYVIGGYIGGSTYDPLANLFSIEYTHEEYGYPYYVDSYIPSTLKSITINTGSIANLAFSSSNCKNIEKISLLNVTQIGYSVFNGCLSLNQIDVLNIDEFLNIKDSNGDSWHTHRGKIYIGGEKLSEITTVTIPSSMTEILPYTFQNFSNLTTINIHNGVNSIRNYAFQNCASLTAITIPDGLGNIQENAFDGCDNLERIVFENTSDWYRFDYNQGGMPVPIDVSNPERNAANIKGDSSDEDYTEGWDSELQRQG